MVRMAGRRRTWCRRLSKLERADFPAAAADDDDDDAADAFVARDLQPQPQPQQLQQHASAALEGAGRRGGEAAARAGERKREGGLGGRGDAAGWRGRRSDVPWADREKDRGLSLLRGPVQATVRLGVVLAGLLLLALPARSGDVISPKRWIVREGFGTTDVRFSRIAPVQRFPTSHPKVAEGICGGGGGTG